ncbi:MAG: hypothetical protein KME06_07210 [Kastovskya adunca ATA6-11-RM4]|jgi:hypothetical protein|nr:hypothetical protein [Kastovskya adunca ATA6-11-RM4]
MSDKNSAPVLHKELGILGAIALGLGSIVGAGVFVSTGIAAGVAGLAVIISLVIPTALVAVIMVTTVVLGGRFILLLVPSVLGRTANLVSWCGVDYCRTDLENRLPQIGSQFV